MEHKMVVEGPANDNAVVQVPSRQRAAQRVSQLLLTRGVELKSEVMRQCAAMIPEGVEFKSVLEQVDRTLRSFDLELKEFTDEFDDKEYLGAANRRNDDIVEGATPMSAEQVAYFKNLIDTIMQDDECKVKCRDARKQRTVQTKTSKTFKVDEVELLLETLVADRWLRRIEHAEYFTLGPRCFADLAGYVESKLKLECVLCFSSIAKAFQCGHQNCSGVYHRACLLKLREKDSKCISCQREFR